MKQIIHWPQLFNAINGTQFQSLFGASAIHNGATLETVVGTPWSVAGTFSNLKVDRNAPPGSGRAVILTLVKNGTPTALAVTITHPAVSASDTVNTVTAVAGDTFSIQYTNTGGAPSSSYGAINLEFDATDDSESGYCTSPSLQVNNADPQYHGMCFCTISSIALPGTSYSTSPDDIETLCVCPLAGTLERIDFAFRTSGLGASGFADMASGDAVTCTVLKNGIVQDGTNGTVNTTTTLTFPATTASWSGTLTVASGDRLQMRVVPTSSMIDLTGDVYRLLWSLRFDATTTNRFWLGANHRVFALSTTEYSALAGRQTPETVEISGHGYGSVSTWYMLNPLVVDAGDGTAFVVCDARLNATSPANAPVVSFHGVEDSGFADVFHLVAVGTAVSPGGTPFTITSADTWNIRQRESNQIIGTTIFGVNTDVTAPLAVAFGLDGATHVCNTPGTVTIYGNLVVTGTSSLSGSVAATPLVDSLVTTGAELVLDSSGNIVSA